MTGLTTEQMLHLLQDVAARVVSPRFRSLVGGEIMEKNPGDLVTVADREAEVLITQALHAAYPGAVVLGEEAHSADPGLMARYLAAEHAFTLDPLDGTKNFVAGSPDHAVMCAETRAGVATRAWIWLPQYETSWVAERGAGTWRNGERMRTRPVAAGTDPVGATSMRRLRGRVLAGLPPLRLSWVSCGVDYPRLIEGAADYLVYGRSHPWDHVPGSLLVAEAGGVMGHPDGSPYSPRSLQPGLVVAADEQTFALVCPPAARALKAHG